MVSPTKTAEMVRAREETLQQEDSDSDSRVEASCQKTIDDDKRRAVWIEAKKLNDWL